MNQFPTVSDSPRKARILIVEDEAIIAFALEESLIGGGFAIAGVAGRIETALAMIESAVFDAAILDTNLAGVSAVPAATALRASGRPFVVVSGYLPSQQREPFAGVPNIQKPYPPERLLQALRDILPAQ